MGNTINIQKWVDCVEKFKFIHKGSTVRNTTRDVTRWYNVKFVKENIDIRKQTASFAGVGLSLFRNQLIPFILLVSIDKFNIELQKIHVFDPTVRVAQSVISPNAEINVNNYTTTTIKYKGILTADKIKLTSRYSHGIIECDLSQNI